MAEHQVLDCRGLSCPQPVLDTREAMEGAAEPLLVLVDNEAACTNVSRFAESRGARVSVEHVDGAFRLTIRPPDALHLADAAPIMCAAPAVGGLVVCVSSEGMGRGDDDLGSVLMAAFLDTLSQFKGELSHVVFLNAGVRLTVEGSPVLDQIRQLADLGAEVLVCGTCLNHYGIKDQLAVGSVSNMYVIIEVLSKAGRIVRP